MTRPEGTARFELQAVLDAAVEAIVIIDARGTIETFNQAAVRLFGYSSDEVIGKNVRILMPEPFRGAHDGYLDNYLRTGKRKIIGIGREVVACRRDGSEFPIALAVGEIHGQPEPRFVGFIHDITEQRASVEALRKSERLLRQAQSLAGLANFETRIPAGDTFWSEEMYRMVGRDPAAGPPAMADFVRRYLDPADQDRFRRKWKDAEVAGGQFELEFRLLPETGPPRFVHSVASLTRYADGGVQLSGTIHDVTERHKAAEEMRQAQERLTQFARLSTMGEMAAGLAHEINQPLTAITTFAQALSRIIAKPGGLDAAEVVTVLEQISAQALRAGDIIRRLRSFVRNREVHQEVLVLSGLMEETLAFTESDARLNNVRLRLDVEDDLPRVRCDPVQIQQVLLNLVRNAIDATVEAAPALREVVVAARLNESGELEVAVCDHGPGISPEVAEGLGNPFFTTKPSGTGLGIAISKSILRAHGGQFGHRQTPGGGATVFFTLSPESTEAP